MSPLLLAIFLVIITYLLYNFVTGKPPNTPPGIPRFPLFLLWGIPRFPLLGSYVFLLWGNYKFPHKAVGYYVKKYKSKLISYYLGGAFTVIANDYKTVKEILTREEFDGRVTTLFIARARAFGKSLGIFFTDGNQWREQRRFLLRNLRDFGFGRRHEKLEADVMEEMRILVDLIKNGPINDDEKKIVKADAVLFPDVLYATMGNIVWLMMSGEKYDRNEHEQLRKISRSAMLFQRESDTTGGAIAILPFLRFFGNLFGFKSMMKGNYGLVNFIKEKIQYYKTTCGENSDKGFIERYLRVLKENGEYSHFSEEQLIMSVTDIVFPALSAAPSVITHCVKYIMRDSRVAEKVREEIDRVVGTGRLVTWADRKDLPYTEATLREAMRIETLTPFSVFHRCSKATTLAGYTLPANTIVITNLSYMHEDPDYWGDPENFRPERFLSESGELIKDPSIPFGFGHRVCAGETFARFVMFGLFANLVQNFEFFFVEGQPTRTTDVLPGLIVTPKDTWIRLVPRV